MMALWSFSWASNLIPHQIPAPKQKSGVAKQRRAAKKARRKKK